MPLRGWSPNMEQCGSRRGDRGGARAGWGQGPGAMGQAVVSGRCPDDGVRWGALTAALGPKAGAGTGAGDWVPSRMIREVGVGRAGCALDGEELPGPPGCRGKWGLRCCPWRVRPLDMQSLGV